MFLHITQGENVGKPKGIWSDDIEKEQTTYVYVYGRI
jgi:hypothetical protein